MLEKKLNINDKVNVYTRHKVPGLKNQKVDEKFKNTGRVVGLNDKGTYEIEFEAKNVESITKNVKIDEKPQCVMTLKDGDPKNYTIAKVELEF